MSIVQHPFKLTEKDGMWEAECPKGLWSVYAADKDDVIAEATRYFWQYAQDGEYGYAPAFKDATNHDVGDVGADDLMP